MKILKQSESPLLKRKRITFTIDHSLKATPSKKDLIKKIAESQKTKEELVVIRHIYNKFGSSQSKIITHIYKDQKILLSLEPKKYHPKKEEAPKPAEAPKEEKSK